MVLLRWSTWLYQLEAVVVGAIWFLLSGLEQLVWSARRRQRLVLVLWALQQLFLFLLAFCLSRMEGPDVGVALAMSVLVFNCWANDYVPRRPTTGSQNPTAFASLLFLGQAELLASNERNCGLSCILKIDTTVWLITGSHRSLASVASIRA